MIAAERKEPTTAETTIVRARPEMVPPPPEAVPSHDTVPCPPPEFDHEVASMMESMVKEADVCP